MSPTYNDPNHPEHKNWLIQRRKRFVQIVREGKRICKLSTEERELAIKLCETVTKGTKQLERIK